MLCRLGVRPLLSCCGLSNCTEALTVDRVVEPLPLFTKPDTGGIAQRPPGNGRGRATEVAFIA